MEYRTYRILNPKSRIQIIWKYIWNIHQVCPYSGPLTKTFKELKEIISYAWSSTTKLQKEVKSLNMWKLKTILLNNPWVKVKVPQELRKHQCNKMCWNIYTWQGKERSQINGLSLHLRKPERSDLNPRIQKETVK